MKTQMLITGEEINGEGNFDIHFQGDETHLKRAISGLLKANINFRCLIIECILNSIGTSGPEITAHTESRGKP